MQTTKLENVQEKLCELFNGNMILMQKTQEKAETKENFSSKLLLEYFDGEGVGIENISASITTALEKEIQELSLTGNILDDKLHIHLKLLNELDRESSQQELLHEISTKELSEVKRNIKLTQAKKLDIKKMLKAREKKGEMAELEGYSKTELDQMESKASALFSSHKHALKLLLVHLFPKHGDQMKQLLTELTDIAFCGSEDGYLDLRQFPGMQHAAMFLLQHQIINHHPSDKRKVCLCIFD